MPFYERQPYIQPLYQIVKEVMRGDIRVPRFQRPGSETTWTPTQRGDLLDSLYRGYPVGTILLWSTSTEVGTLDHVGGFGIPSGSEPIRRLLLDGHQRLSTLVRILGPGFVDELQKEGTPVIEVADRAPEEWVFELRDGGLEEDSRARFVLLKEGQKPSETQIPLSLVMQRSRLNRWIREKGFDDALQAAADAIRDRLREYSLPVAVLAADTLQEATESFKRINSSGTPMSDFHMATALAYAVDTDPQQQFADGRAEHLAPVGWGALSNTDMLRVAAGLDERQNPAKLDVQVVAKRLRTDAGLVTRAFRAVRGAAELLATYGVHGPESLPYGWQLILLAVRLGRTAPPGGPMRFDEREAAIARRWFWLTTYGEAFAGASSAVVSRSLGAVVDMLGGGSWERMERDLSRRVRALDAFDFRTARSKACALAMARAQDDGDLNGPAHHALTRGVDAMQILKPRGLRSEWWTLAIVTDELRLDELRALVQRRVSGAADPGDIERLCRLGVATDDAGADVDELLRARRRRLDAAEQSFVEELGLTWARDD